MKECTIRDISPLSEEVIFELRLKHELWSSKKRWVGRKRVLYKGNNANALRLGDVQCFE